ncbi:hypothetical protein AMS58_13700 [Pseudoalteromonas porphyrae]|uniref:AAA family ATPase n=1 Tax=Pseudoalteromonas porphyrae TaxID=187330 RepID=UPI0006BA9D1C|nr:AAA family ATPase [Pseudoalteromonas porphyrae]KPH94170.1 hypothetical protein AMS58_13700 [Pseudoalteromonas porphyrae]
MRFLKIYIKNFKGLTGVNIADLDKNTTLLTGPNGFGKTTIFDAIELCLTGSIHRTKVKENVTKDLKDYKKPFFQNDVKNEVTLKLLLENKCGKKLVIVRHLHKESNQRPKVTGKKNKANEFGILSLFTEDSEAFSQESFDLDNAEVLTQADITNFFEFADEDIDISSIYPIFNYLQQEETTFFLKKSEHDRKNSLGFLLRTDTQEKKLKSISDKYSKLCELRDFFNEKLSSIKLTSVESVEYEKVFKEQEIDFDAREPFVGVKEEFLKEKLESYLSKLLKVSDFINYFSPAEFLLRENSEKVKSLIINSHEFKEHYVLQNFLQDSKYHKLQDLFSDINNVELIEGYILQDLINQVDIATKVNKTIENISKFNAAKDKEVHLEQLVIAFLPELLDTYNSILNTRKSLTTSLKGLNKSIYELKSTIRELEGHFSNIQSNEDKCKCPYCGSKFDDLEKLSNSMKERLLTFDNLSTDNTRELDLINLRFENEISKPISLKIKEFEKKNSKYDDLLIQKLIVLGKSQQDYSRIDTLLGKKNDYKWGALSSIKELNESREIIQSTLRSLFPMVNDVWSKIIELRGKSYQKAYDLIDTLQIPPGKMIEQGSSQLEMTTLTNYVEDFSRTVSDYNSQNRYDPAKSDDPDNIFGKYFNNDSGLFTQFDKNVLESKKAYLNYIVSSRESEQYILNKSKFDELTTIINKLGSLKEIYSDEIKNYKKEMIKRIQIPFFIYTAKILQNYQQGMGIFIFVKDDSAIRFIANGDSDHDIMHHLSSGQLAVVALAFCLAVNKTFEISQNLKFLAIDDPVQEMDALNIHSFLDLVRTELADDYQLIFSTHDYDNALFMKYKLEKLDKNTVNLIDVQQRFFPPISNV